MAKMNVSRKNYNQTLPNLFELLCRMQQAVERGKREETSGTGQRSTGSRGLVSHIHIHC
jgi:hypothetical protein